jgi:hypothetical protein
MGGIAVLLVRVPWAFWAKGTEIRGRSEWAHVRRDGEER